MTARDRVTLIHPQSLIYHLGQGKLARLERVLAAQSTSVTPKGSPRGYFFSEDSLKTSLSSLDEARGSVAALSTTTVSRRAGAQTIFTAKLGVLRRFRGQEPFMTLVR